MVGDFIAHIFIDGVSVLCEFAWAWIFSGREKPPSTKLGSAQGSVRQAVAAKRAARAAARRLRDRERGAVFEWDGHRIADIAFSRAELAGRRASELTTRRLRLLAESWPDRTVRLGIRRYLDLHRPGWRKRARSTAEQ
jgi:hypothetical protein